MKSKQIFTDKNHTETALEIFPSEKVSRANTLHIGETANEQFTGFGVALTGASCYNLSLMDADERTRLLKSIYSDEGLDLSVGRLSIGASDYSAELYSYNDVAFDTKLEHFSIERDETYIIPMIQEILKIKPNLYLFASPWSPPGWMKTGESMCGGYMREQYVDCYADYIIKFIEAYAEHGIKISAITPQNESNAQQSGQMPACIWHPEIEAKFVTTLKRKLQEEQLDVQIWLFDHNFADVDRPLWQLKNCEGVDDACDAVAFHYYSGTIEETLKLKRAFPKKALHFTEGGPRLLDNYDCDWCKWGIMIAKALNCGYKSFTGWNLMLNETGGPNIGPFWCGGLVTRNTETGDLTYSGQYKAFRHIAKYIKPHSKLYPVSVDETYGTEIFAYPKYAKPIEGVFVDNGDGKNILLFINPNSEKKQTQMYLNNIWWYIELMPDSISTIIIED